MTLGRFFNNFQNFHLSLKWTFKKTHEKLSTFQTPSRLSEHKVKFNVYFIIFIEYLTQIPTCFCMFCLNFFQHYSHRKSFFNFFFRISVEPVWSSSAFWCIIDPAYLRDKCTHIVSFKALIMNALFQTSLDQANQFHGTIPLFMSPIKRIFFDFSLSCDKCEKNSRKS